MSKRLWVEVPYLKKKGDASHCTAHVDISTLYIAVKGAYVQICNMRIQEKR